MQVRALQKKDFDYIVSVLDSWWGGPSGIPIHPIFFYEFGHHALVVEKSDQVIGFLLGFMTHKSPETGYIHMVGIHPEHRRAGVGKRLYEEFTEYAKRSGAVMLKTIAIVGDEGPFAFHRALGFDVQEIKDYAGPGRSRMVFIKRLLNA